MRRHCAYLLIALSLVSQSSSARTLASQVAELDHIPAIRPEFPVPNEPNQLFYIERSVNANTVVYAARFDKHGQIDSRKPVDVYWRWYNVDGHRKPLNFIEDMLAYGVRTLPIDPPNAVAVKVVALPERQLVVDEDAKGRPEALIQIGKRTAKLVYVYLQVDNSGLMPNVTALDLFGVDKTTGKILREHIVQD
jgi:hypothetical protein